MPRTNLLRCTRGVTIVEFALIAPMLLFVLCAAIEMGHLIFARQMLEGALIEAARAATASMETGENDRATIMRKSVADTMKLFPAAAGKSITVTTTVFADFASVTPEIYTDANKNGKYDQGESFVDRNKNGKWDPSTPKTGVMGGAGDVVSYTVTYPKAVLFQMVGKAIGYGDGTEPLSATTVVRNEALRRNS
ncbi:TadE/TadG family type IV pilus assembly protein [Sphingomonas sp. Mn802worker]|uniref:TadE/TadG family type IV pilus assembly protein n=1 Tax=Sphingomonas sp. Mn802worker TaxID=629773 RepID=UPI00039BDE97|nr:TadE family protein [Sphingomonas sp. Mn802worker]